MANKKVNKVPEKVGEELRNLGLTPEEAGWDCHGTYVLLHKALEKVAASKGIKFDEPKIINADISAKEAVVLVTGHLGDKSEWSFGEAAPYNSKNSYPFAMAEKRAKDRVILKLVGLHGDVYSEGEADEFQEIIANERGSNTVEQKDKTWQEEVAESSDIEIINVDGDTDKLFEDMAQTINQLIVEQKDFKDVADYWLTSISAEKKNEDYNLLDIKSMNKKIYDGIVEHRDLQLRHHLKDVSDKKELQKLITVECKSVLNALKKQSADDYKEIMAIATERKTQLQGES